MQHCHGIPFSSIIDKDQAPGSIMLVIHPIMILIGANGGVIMINRDLTEQNQSMKDKKKTVIKPNQSNEIMDIQ